jgi:serine/threonine protein kinase
MSSMSQQANAADRSSSDAVERWPTIPGYEIVGEIAAGGMATVYLGRRITSSDPDPLVAIKYCHPHLRRDPTFVSMFLDETRLASLIRHPNVIATLDVGNAESLYFVMQYVEGVSLADWLTRLAATGARLAVPLLIRVILDTLAGLAAAHALTDDAGNLLKLVHRDISPQNILVGLDGVARIGDFGIAKAESRATRTRTGQVKGKTGYMSPEQILLEPLDRRSDLYAVGVVLWEALTGKRLFDSDSDAATINLVLGARIPAPSTIAEAERALDDLVLRALSFSPSDRFATADDFAQALGAAGIQIAEHRRVGEDIAQLFAVDLQRRRDDAVGRQPRGNPAASGEPANFAQRCSDSRPQRQGFGILVKGLLLATTAVMLLVGMVYLLNWARHRDAADWQRQDPPLRTGSVEARSAATALEPALASTIIQPEREGFRTTEHLTSPLSSTRGSDPSRTARAQKSSKTSLTAANSATSSGVVAPPVTTRGESSGVAAAAPATPSARPRGRSTPSEYRPNDL